MRYRRENVQTRVILGKDNDKKNFLASTLYTHNFLNNRLTSDERHSSCKLNILFIILRFWRGKNQSENTDDMVYCPHVQLYHVLVAM